MFNNSKNDTSQSQEQMEHKVGSLPMFNINKYDESHALAINMPSLLLKPVIHFQENTGGIRPGLSDNAGRQIIASKPTFLADSLRVTAQLFEQSTFSRDVSLYRTYAYMVTNVGDTNSATVALRAQEIHKLVTETVLPGQTVVLTPDNTLPYPVFDDLLDITFQSNAATTDLEIRFTGQLEETLSGLPLAPFAWGSGTTGQLGDSSNFIDRLRPVQTLGIAGVKAITGGNNFSLALLSDGTVWTWGRNSSGQLGDGTNIEHWVPKQVYGVSNIVAIAAGDSHSMALRSDGTVFAWGNNSDGRLGDGTDIERSAPVQVVGVGGSGFLCDIVGISAGDAHSLALRSDGAVFAWGSNDFGQLGNNNPPTPSFTPIQVLGVGGAGFLSNIIAISAANQGEHCVALRSNGKVFAWGRNDSGQLGDGTNIQRNTPIQVLGVGGSGFLNNIESIEAGRTHTLALNSKKFVFAWGRNDNGQLGDGTNTNKNTPTQVLAVGGSGFLNNIVSLAASDHCLALTSDGLVIAWGRNNAGQLGDNTTTDKNIPVNVITISNVKAIGVGLFQSLAVVG